MPRKKIMRAMLEIERHSLAANSSSNARSSVVSRIGIGLPDDNPLGSRDRWMFSSCVIVVYCDLLCSGDKHN